MNFEDYVSRMANKCQLAVATAVIKNKPPDISNEDYIAQIREKINEKNEEFVDADICSDDFVINDNDFEFTNDDVYINANLDDTAPDMTIALTKDINSNEIEAQNEPAFIYDVEIEENTSVDFQDFNDHAVVKSNGAAFIEITPLNSGHRGEDSLNEVLSTLRQLDDSQLDQVHNPTNNFTQDIFGENSQMYLPLNSHSNEHMAKDVPFINLNITTDRDDDIIVDERLKFKVLRNIKTLNKKENIQETTNDVYKDFDMEIPRNVIDLSLNEKHESNIDFVKEKAALVRENIEKEIANRQHCSNYNIYDAEDLTEINTEGNKAYDTQKTILYTLHGYTENSQISQSQCQNIEIPNKFIIGNKNKISVNNLENIIANNDASDNKAKNTYNDEVADKIAKDTEDNVNDGNKKVLTVDSSQIQYIIDNSGKTYAVLQSYPVNDNSKAYTNNDTELEDKLPSKETNFDNNNLHKHSDSQAMNGELQIKQNAVTEGLEIQKDINAVHKDIIAENTELFTYENRNERTISNSYEIIEDTQMSQETAVPFKVVKELSKIKTFLNRRDRRVSTDGFSSDSGYRSDSQSSVISGAHLSENWMNQSAHCLYSYITQCPLVGVTQEIVKEISKVLGRLIDRLYEEEKYPKFVEELLEKIDSLLGELYEGGDSSEDVLLQKDELIQRLLLLNKSTHILKFTIDKITAILEKTYTQLMSEETLYELTNIDRTENLNHIFHLLNNLIKKFVKERENFISQTTQNSQESHRILRKSSITEIWRRKWNPNCKEIKNVGSQEKGCCLEKCGVVLNKIIVQCMDGYSLVSFAALQCFNLLQN